VNSLLKDEWPWFTTNLIKPIEAITVIRVQQSRQLIEKNDKDNQNSTLLFLGFAAASVLLMTIIAYLMARQINTGVRRLSEMAHAAAGGDMCAKAEESNDEIGEIGQSMNHLVTAIRSLIAEARAADVRLLTVAAEMASEASMMAERNGVIADKMGTGSAAVEGMSQAAAEIAEHAVEVSRHADTTRDAALQGQVVMSNAISGVDDAIRTIEGASASVSELTQRIDEIGGVANVIREIADQTNLLALNAAIEAARAGDTGRGFAVVADEVRKLAEKTANSTKSIADSVAAVHTAAAGASSSMRQTQQKTRQMQDSILDVERSLQSIKTSADSLVVVSDSIASATREQQAGTASTADSFAVINTLSEESQKMATGLRHLADEVKVSAAETDTMLSRFQIGAVETPALMEWSEDIATGHQGIDSQHRILIDFINRLNIAMQSDDRAATDSIIAGLVDYAQKHFAYEEAMMRETSYSDYDDHRKKHAELMNDVRSRCNGFKDGTVTAHHIIAFLMEWLITHIQRTDKILAKHLGAG